MSVSRWYSISGNQILDALETLPLLCYCIDDNIQMSSAPFTPNITSSKEVQTASLSPDAASASTLQDANMVLQEEMPLRDTHAMSPSMISSVNWVMLSPVVTPSGAFTKQFVKKKDDDLEKLKDKFEEYKQKEAKMHTIIYESISDFVFNEIEGKATAALVWKKLISIMTGKGDLMHEHLLTQLGNMSCSDEGNMQEHLGKIKILCEHIEGMGLEIEDNQYTSMI
ncbi:hypothetical protein EDD85DRAFT_950276 [Armillaria nabsnona]|nr:hypothetical protein EDD85DRAFT_950276 [Armillaria nabsnona]